MLLKSKDMLKKFSFYINRVCVGKNHCFQKLVLVPALGFTYKNRSGRFCPQKCPLCNIPIVVFMSAWTADPGWALLDGQCMTSVCVEVILNSSCQTDFIYFMKVCASCCIWVAVQWSQVENWNSGTQGKNCASDQLNTYAARP